MGLIITTTLCALTGCAGKPQKTEMPHEETNLRSCCRIYTSTSCSCGLILSDDPEKTIVAATVHGTTDWGEGSRVVFYDGSEAFGQLFGA
ncbi:MAG: hypothetical protein K5888_11120, partial [Lachnospiraceae bacterium]|nr:hypothetical protein [Lachnospiraceae bacterium]